MRRSFAAALVVFGACGTAFADGDNLGKGWISMPEVMIRAYALGFVELSEIEAEDGVWKVKGLKDGTFTKMALDPHTGDVVPMPSKPLRRGAKGKS